MALDKANISITENTLKCIYHFIEMYKNEKNPEILSFISLFIEKFYNELLKLDPKVKNFILESDKQRSIRAYEVKKYTKKSLYDWTENTKPIFDPDLFQKFFIHPPKDLLLRQINLRINRMFKQRVKQEVKKFSKLRIHPDLSANKVIGLQEIKDHLKKKITLTEVKNLIQIRTRQYAKRQFTWARGKMSSWKIINPKNYKDILDTLVN